MNGIRPQELPRFLERVPFCFYSRTFTPSEHQLPNKTAANTTRQTTLRAEDEVGDGLSGLYPDGWRYRSNHCPLVVHVKRGHRKLRLPESRHWVNLPIRRLFGNSARNGKQKRVYEELSFR